MMREGRIARASGSSFSSKLGSDKQSWQEQLCNWNMAATALLGAALMFLGYMTLGPGLGGQKHLYVAPTHTVDTIGGFRGAAKSIKLIESSTIVENYGRISYIEARPLPSFSTSVSSTRPNLLFLPDSTHSIEGLKSMHMLEVFAQHGYHCYAVDLPGTGTHVSRRSKGPELTHKKKMDYSSFNEYDAWMRGLFKSLDLRQTVVISMGSSSWYGLSMLYHSAFNKEKTAAGNSNNNNNNNKVSVKLKGADSSYLRGMVFVAPHKVSIKNTEERLKKVSIPLLLVRGDLDDAKHVSENVHFLGSSPQFQSITVPKSGRYPFEIQFTRFNTEVMSFLVDKCSIPKAGVARKKATSNQPGNSNNNNAKNSNVKTKTNTDTNKQTTNNNNDNNGWFGSWKWTWGGNDGGFGDESDEDDSGFGDNDDESTEWMDSSSGDIESEDVLSKFFDDWNNDDDSDEGSSEYAYDSDEDDQESGDYGDDSDDDDDSYAFQDDDDDSEDDSHR